MKRNFTVSWLDQEKKTTAETAHEAASKVADTFEGATLHPGVKQPPQHGCQIWRFSVTTEEIGFSVWVRERYSFEYEGEGN